MTRLEQGVKDKKTADLWEVKTNLPMVRAPGAKDSRLDAILEDKLGMVRATGNEEKEKVTIIDTAVSKKKEAIMEMED